MKPATADTHEKRTALKTDLFADEQHRKKIDALGDPQVEIASYIDVAVLTEKVDQVAPRPLSSQGGHPPYLTETMVRILVLKRLYTLSDEQSLHLGNISFLTAPIRATPHRSGELAQGARLSRGRARANFAMTMMAACDTLKRRVYFRKAGVKAF